MEVQEKARKVLEKARKVLEEDRFPLEGNVRAEQSAKYLGIARSTFFLWVSQGRIEKPVKHGARISVWEASYIRKLAKNGVGG